MSLVAFNVTVEPVPELAKSPPTDTAPAVAVIETLPAAEIALLVVTAGALIVKDELNVLPVFTIGEVVSEFRTIGDRTVLPVPVPTALLILEKVIAADPVSKSL
jgi:hypothetical protein